MGDMMNQKELFRTVVKLSSRYLLKQDSKHTDIVDMIEASYMKILRFPLMDDGNFLMVRLSTNTLRDEHLSGDGEDVFEFFKRWLTEFTYHEVVALYSDDLTDCLFFFENLSDATMFKLKWCG